MHPYLPHLLTDIKAAHRPEGGREREHSPVSLWQELEEAERYATVEPELTLGYYCGLKVEDFPPPEQLSARDLKRVCKAFREMLLSWNADISLPDTLPLSFEYRLTTGTLNERFEPVNYGHITFDFCTGYAPDCALKEYCPCLEFWNSPSG